jgi:hypothetical protein
LRFVFVPERSASASVSATARARRRSSLASFDAARARRFVPLNRSSSRIGAFHEFDCRSRFVMRENMGMTVPVVTWSPSTIAAIVVCLKQCARCTYALPEACT